MKTAWKAIWYEKKKEKRMPTCPASVCTAEHSRESDEAETDGVRSATIRTAGEEH